MICCNYIFMLTMQLICQLVHCLTTVLCTSIYLDISTKVSSVLDFVCSITYTGNFAKSAMSFSRLYTSSTYTEMNRNWKLHAVALIGEEVCLNSSVAIVQEHSRSDYVS